MFGSRGASPESLGRPPSRRVCPRRAARLALLGLALAAAPLLGAGPALADDAVTVQCGQVLTVSTKVANDLSDCPGSGLVIGAHFITVDLNGHTIGGDGNPSQGPYLDAGIDDLAGLGFTVQNGEVRGFDAGVFVFDAPPTTVRSLTASSNTAGVRVEAFSAPARIERSTISGNAQGIFIIDSPGALIQQNVMSNNLEGILLQFLSSPQNRASAQIIRNTLSGNDEGINLGDSDGNQVANNSISGGELGILVEGTENRIERNSVSGSAFDGIDVSGPASGTVVSRNALVANGFDGVAVGDLAAGTLLTQNTASGNGHDGLSVLSAATTITKNTANDNANLGIEAVAGVSDGGGNKARGNGNPAQCIGVACS